MRICHGLTGKCFEVEDRELQWRRPTDVIRQCAHDHWNVDPEDLIVLVAGGLALGTTAEAETACRGRDVFLFLRSSLDPKGDSAAEQLAAEVVGRGEIDDRAAVPPDSAPEDQGIVSEHPFDSDDPAFEAFRRDILEARRRIDEARPAAALASRAEGRAQVQRLAAQAVLDNLTSHRSTCSRSMSLFLQKYERVQERFDQNLGKVGACMAALGSVRLHPSLRTTGRESLADVVPSDRILRFTSGLQDERARLAQRLERLRQQDSGTQALCDQVSEKVRQLIEEEDVATAAAAIRNELARAELELLPALRATAPSQGAPPESVLEAERRSGEALADLSRVCSSTCGLLAELQGCWERRHSLILQRLREVSYIQSKVRGVERQAALLEEEINMQRSQSLQLGHLQKMPKAYQKALTEVARRRQFRARYCAQAEQARGALARMVEEENGRRRGFVSRYGCHLPADLIQGLGSMAPAATVEVASFDGQLPDIDLASLREAPAEEDEAEEEEEERAAAGPPRTAAPAARCEMPASSSSASSSRRSPWGPGASASAGGGASAEASSGGGLSGGAEASSGGSAHAGSQRAAASASASTAANVQRGAHGEGTAASVREQGSCFDGPGGQDQSRISELEARNRDLQLKVDSLMQELSRSQQLDRAGDSGGAPAAGDERPPQAV